MKHILIVEDDIDYANILAMNFEARNVSSHIVNSGNEAIEWLRSNKSHVIITDIRMPNGSGIELIQWNARQQNIIPLIAVSGDLMTQSETTQFCEIMGVPYMSKPLDMNRLFEVVEPLLLLSV